MHGSVLAQGNAVRGRDASLGRFLTTGLAITQQTLPADGLHMWVASKRWT